VAPPGRTVSGVREPRRPFAASLTVPSPQGDEPRLPLAPASLAAQLDGVTGALVSSASTS
jgi:hypothetical protein